MREMQPYVSTGKQVHHTSPVSHAYSYFNIILPRQMDVLVSTRWSEQDPKHCKGPGYLARQKLS